MVTDVEIREVATGVWDAMLSMPLDDYPGPKVAEYVTGCVQITGGWNGAVTVELSARFARAAAAALFALEEADVGEDEIRDAVGELANVVGGNIKALMPGGCQLSLPAVVQGRDDQLTVARGRLLARAPLSSLAEPVSITVYEEFAAESVASSEAKGEQAGV
jgi:chemotaxis protein CheX